MTDVRLCAWCGQPLASKRWKGRFHDPCARKARGIQLPESFFREIGRKGGQAPHRRRWLCEMPPAVRRALSRSGARKASALGRDGHRWTPREAKRAGRKGAIAGHARGTGHRFTSETARAAARIRNAKRAEVAA